MNVIRGQFPLFSPHFRLSHPQNTMAISLSDLKLRITHVKLLFNGQIKAIFKKIVNCKHTDWLRWLAEMTELRMRVTAAIAPLSRQRRNASYTANLHFKILQISTLSPQFLELIILSTSSSSMPTNNSAGRVNLWLLLTNQATVLCTSCAAIGWHYIWLRHHLLVNITLVPNKTSFNRRNEHHRYPDPRFT